MNMDGAISAICQHWAILLFRPLKMSQKIVFRLVLVFFHFFLTKTGATKKSSEWVKIYIKVKAFQLLHER